MSGICGNFNGKDSDDYDKRDGNEATNDGDLGDGWANELSCSSPKDTDFYAVCEKNIDRKNWARKGKLKEYFISLFRC